MATSSDTGAVAAGVLPYPRIPGGWSSMASDGQSIGSVQAAHLAEGIALIREDLRRMAEDIKQRPTHSDLGSLKLLVEKQIELVQQKLDQRNEHHEREMRYLTEKYESVKQELGEIEQRQETSEADKKKLQWQVIVGFLGALGAAAGGTVWQGFMT